MITLGINNWIQSNNMHRLFGYGADYAIELLRSHAIRGWTKAVDNSYITILLNYGIVGLGLFLLFLIISIKNFVVSDNKLVKMSSLIVISIYISAFFYDIFGWFTCTMCFSLFLLLQDKATQ